MPAEVWSLLRTPPAAAAWNMAVDEFLMSRAADAGSPTLRFYSWAEPAATFGYFQRHADIASWTPLRPLIRRPTGGGLVPHDADWTYSMAFPPGHWWYESKAEESYQRLHDWVARSFARLKVPAVLAPCCEKVLPGQCFSGAEKSDLLFEGRKIAGAAQRRSKRGLLIQGSVRPPLISLDRAAWERAMLASALESFGAELVESSLDNASSLEVAGLAASKYATPGHNQKR